MQSNFLMTAASEAVCEPAESSYVSEEEDFIAIKWLSCQEDF